MKIFDFIKKLFCKHEHCVDIGTIEKRVHTIKKTCIDCKAVVYSESHILKGKNE